MSDMTEDRVYGNDAGTTEVFVAAGIGVVSVSVSADRIGRFGVTRRCSPRDIAGGDGRLAVAAEEDVLVRQEGEFVRTGFGSAVAVGVHGGAVLAADPDGRVARRAGGKWSTLATLDASVRAIDGPLLATDRGVHRIGGDGDGNDDGDVIRPAGLEAVNDVAARGPYAATDEGLYTLGNGWMAEIEGQFGTVAASREHAYAAGSPRAGDAGLHERRDGGWRPVDLPIDGAVADVVGGRGYAITERGTLLSAPDWRSRSLGVRGVVGIAIPSQ